MSKESGLDSQQVWSAQREKGLGTTETCLESVPEVISWLQLVNSVPTCGLKSDWSNIKFKAVLRRFFIRHARFILLISLQCLKRLIILVSVVYSEFGVSLDYIWEIWTYPIFNLTTFRFNVTYRVARTSLDIRGGICFTLYKVCMYVCIFFLFYI